MGAARCLALAAACQLAGFANVAHATGVVERQAQLRGEWVLYANNSLCGFTGNFMEVSYMDLGVEFDDLQRCQAAASNEAGCGPFLISNAPHGYHGTFQCRCLKPFNSRPTQCVLTSSSIGSNVYRLDTGGPYSFLHDGHCADSWIRGSNTRQDSVDACAQHCFKNQRCGFFAYDAAPNTGHTCAVYTKDGDCPDDDLHESLNAYEVRREWVLYANNSLCGFTRTFMEVSYIDLGGEFDDLQRCQDAASNEAGCGPFLISNAPHGYHGIFRCRCLKPFQSRPTQCVLTSSSIGSNVYRLDAGAYSFRHGGHCADGWIRPNTNQSSLENCSRHCLENQSCGFFASDLGQTCALYSRDGSCSNDDRYSSYNAYKIDRKWVLHASSMFCSNPADNRVDLGAGKTLEACQAAALKDLRCGKLAISNAPRSSASCQCLRAGITCDLAESGVGNNVYVWDSTAGV